MAAWTLPHTITVWRQFLTTTLDRRSRPCFLTLILGMVLSTGRRTVSSWLRAAGVADDWQDHYYFLQTVGRATGRVAKSLLHLAVRQIPATPVGEFVKLALDDSPTTRYGPKIELAGIHHNPTPGPEGSEFLYGHVWVTISWLVNHASIARRPAVGRSVSPTKSRRSTQIPEKTGLPRDIFRASTRPTRRSKNPKALECSDKTRNIAYADVGKCSIKDDHG